MTCFHSNIRYHPAIAPLLRHRRSLLIVNVGMYVDVDVDVDVDVGDDDMAMEVQTRNSIRHKILAPYDIRDFDSLIVL